MTRLRELLRRGGSISARGVAVAVFLVALAVVATLSATASGVGVVVISTFVSFYLLKAALPADRLDEAATQLATGEAGVRAWEWLLDKLPGVDR